MKIFVSGSIDRLNEFGKIIAGIEQVVYTEYGDGREAVMPEALNTFDLIVDLNLDEEPARINHYSRLTGNMVIGCAVKKTLSPSIHRSMYNK